MPKRLPSTTSPALTFTVARYSEKALAKALQNEWVDQDATAASQHFELLKEYLGPEEEGLAAKTLVTESPYISQSYLEDYASYYAQCFAPYDRYCKRVHFFGKRFLKAELLAALSEKESALWESYLGYIVVRPIPAPLGATLLRPYPPGQKEARVYPVKRSYRVNVLGRELSVETLIWQQQDYNVSVCATTALWMAFHKTAFMFQTPLPSPYRITESAGNVFTTEGRAFPNQGLDTYQILKSIESVGLVAELRNQFKEPLYLTAGKKTQQLREIKAFIYAYLRLGLPVLVSVDFGSASHLVVVTGYRKPEPDYAFSESLESIATEEDAAESEVSEDSHHTEDGLATVESTEARYIARYSDGITRLYVHDDGVGPYSRFGFDEERGLVITGWPDDDEDDGKERAHLFELIAPLSADIRISHEQIYTQVTKFYDLFDHFKPAYATPEDTAPVVWDIYLHYSSIHKQEILDSTAGTVIQRQRVATRLLPKYVWIARALFRGQPLVEFIFDATDLHTGFYCLLTTTYEPLRSVLEADFSRETYTTADILTEQGIPRYLNLFQDDLGLPISEL
jgi:hypothetical protein